MRAFTGKPRNSRVTQRPVSSTAQPQARQYSLPLPPDAETARRTVDQLSSIIGPRVEGTAEEKDAALYLKSQLEGMGYQVGWQEFALPDGVISRNLIASDPGTGGRYVFTVSAHIDSRPGTPGANDNASGCASVLELARTLKNTKHIADVRFLLFGAEEDWGPDRDPKRIGSAFYVNHLTAEDRAKIVGMLSLDMVGVGNSIYLRDWGTNSQRLVDSLSASAAQKGIATEQKTSGMSDHEAFGATGIPAVWLERMLPGGGYDPMVHEPGDTIERVDLNAVMQVVGFVQKYLLELDESSCQSILGAQVAPAK